MKEKKIPTEQEAARLQAPKSGILRLFELIDRDGPKFLKAGGLAFLGIIPWMAAVTLAVAGAMPVMLLLCIPAGILAAPEVCGAADTVMRSLRDEIGWWWWDTYRTAWKRNARATLLPGGLFGFLAGAQVYSFYTVALLDDPGGDFWLLAAAAVAEIAILSHYLPMLVCMDLPFPTLLRNCFVLFFSHPLKSLWAAVLQFVYYFLILTWFPLTSPFLLLFSVWLPMAVTYLILYPVLDKHFGLSAAYQELQKKRWAEE